MNERIKQLAEQSGCKVMDDGEWYIPSATGLEKIVYTKGIGLEKFAELIVWECQDRVEHYIRDCGEIGSLPDTVIMKHFGVKE